MIFLSTIVPVIPLVVGLIFLKRIEKYRRYLVWLTGLSLLLQVIVHFFFVNKWNNQLLFHLYTPIEFLILGSIYKIWFSDWWLGKYIPLIIGSFIGLAILNALFLQPIDSPNSYAIMVSSVFLILLAILYFFRILDTMALGSLEKSPEFWINTSILLYYSGSLLILGLNHLIVFKSNELINAVWSFHDFFNILHYLLYAIGLWIPPKQ